MLVDGVPAIDLSSIHAAAVALHQNDIFQTRCTERELFATLARRCNEATERALSKFTKDDLQNMGIRFRSSPMLDWTHLNTSTVPPIAAGPKCWRRRGRGTACAHLSRSSKTQKNSGFGSNPNERVFHIRTPRTTCSRSTSSFCH